MQGVVFFGGVGISVNKISTFFFPHDDIQPGQYKVLCLNGFDGFGRMPQILSPFSPLDDRQTDRCGKSTRHTVYSVREPDFRVEISWLPILL